VKTVSEQLCPNPQRTVLRPFRVAGPEYEGKEDGRTARIIERVLALDATSRDAELEALVSTLKRRHDDVVETLDRRFAELKARFDGRLDVDQQHGRLIAAFLTKEYS
jgi:hypothetical protein